VPSAIPTCCSWSTTTPPGQHLTRYLNRENPINKALLEKGQGERALDKVLDAAKSDPSVYYLEASINPNGVEIGKVLDGRLHRLGGNRSGGPRSSASRP
jgi:hypothetical protein